MRRCVRRRCTSAPARPKIELLTAAQSRALATAVVKIVADTRPARDPDPTACTRRRVRRAADVDGRQGWRSRHTPRMESLSKFRPCG
jgi:hypothetical protein